VALGVRHALDKYGLERVAIIDFDVHHGNGTQDIFQDEKRVLLCSSFEHPFYPGYDEEMDNEHIINVPLAPGTQGEFFREAVAAAWFEKLKAFKPQFIFFSAGFDAHVNDPLADLHLVLDDYVWLTREIAKLAKVHAEGRMVSTLEGGYDLKALAECVPAHVEAMC
jgi:acetoin utilization deacetylase AcuC-like enzyme